MRLELVKNRNRSGNHWATFPPVVEQNTDEIRPVRVPSGGGGRGWRGTVAPFRWGNAEGPANARCTVARLFQCSTCTACAPYPPSARRDLAMVPSYRCSVV